MYRVLLADSDAESVLNFRRYITSSYPNYRIVKSISSVSGDYMGDIVKAEPQLIIADVRFFGVNGPYCFAELGRKLPTARFILYGGYNDRDYLERSVEEQKLDYIIKPVKPTDLGRALESAEGYLRLLVERENQLKELSESLKKKSDEFRNMFLQALINGVVTDEDEIRENFRYYNLDLIDNFTVAQIKIDHFKTLNMTMSVEEKHYLIYRIFSIADLCLEPFNHLCFINGFNTVTVIISGANNLAEIFKPMEHIKNEVSSKLKTAVTVGIGRTYNRLNEIPISYREAESATSHRFYIGYNIVIPIEFVDSENIITYRYPLLKEDKLIFAATSGEFEYCKNLLNDIFDALRKSEPLPEKLIAQTVICILISIERRLLELNKFNDVKIASFFAASEAMKIKTVDEGYTYMYSNLQKFCQSVTEARLKMDESLFIAAKEYVGKKYYEAISLQKAAIEIKTTPEYLNKLFIANEGCGYFDYVTRVRMEIAKRFLTETDMDDKAIAVNIGYDNGGYFKAIFRQYEKMEAHEYRNLYRRSS